MSEEREFVLKVCICGDSSVGKTSLINQYIEEKFEEDYRPTLGANLLRKDVDFEHEGEKFHCRLVLWDLAGQEKYEMVRSLYYQGCLGAFLVYDITRNDTFDSITNVWLTDFKNNAKKEASYIVLGNKVDLKDDRQVSTEKGKSLADEIQAADFIETSAKTGENVDQAFKTMVMDILRRFGEIK